MRRLFAGVILLTLGLTMFGSRVDAVPTAEVTSSRVVLGYYVPYDPASWTSLEQQAHLIDIVAAQWVTIDPCGRLASRDDQTLKSFATSRGIQVFPSLLTSSSWLNHRLLTDEEVSAVAVAEIVDYVLAEGYDGFDLDLEDIWVEDRAAYTGFVTRLGAALHERGKRLALAIPAKTTDARTGWAGAFDYAALGAQADLVTIMAYEYHGGWGGPGPIAPYGWVEQVTAYATLQIPAEKVLLGLALYGHDWNTTSGGARYLGYPEAAALSARYAAPITLDPTSRSETLRYSAPAGEPPPVPIALPALRHEVTRREPPPCPISEPARAPSSPSRPTPDPDAVQEHEVWLEAGASAAARLPLADRHKTGGVAVWRLGHEEPGMWAIVDSWRRGEPRCVLHAHDGEIVAVESSRILN